MTALMFAAKTGHTNVVDSLITKGNANVEAKDASGKTALNYATEYRRTKLVDLLTRVGKRQRTQY